MSVLCSQEISFKIGIKIVYSMCVFTYESMRVLTYMYICTCIFIWEYDLYVYIYMRLWEFTLIYIFVYNSAGRQNGQPCSQRDPRINSSKYLTRGLHVICVYIPAYIHAYIHTCIYMVCTYTYISYIHIHVWIHAYTHAYIHTCIYMICTYTYISYIYIHVYMGYIDMRDYAQTPRTMRTQKDWQIQLFSYPTTRMSNYACINNVHTRVDST